jgi:hypothetical protein
MAMDRTAHPPCSLRYCDLYCTQFQALHRLCGRSVILTLESHGMRLSRKELIVCLLIFGVPGLAWIGSEVRWARIINPVGRFATASEYLAAGRLPSRVATLTTNDNKFVIAYSPMDYRLAVPSGPAAYVFDESGRMITWSHDTGDDGRFQRAWPLRQQQKGSIEDLRTIGFQPDGAANGSQPIRSETNRTSSAAGSRR